MKAGFLTGFFVKFREKNMKNLLSLILISLFINLSAQSAEEQINQFLDNWHHAAAVADEDSFFGSMTADARYIGTDESENWQRDELRKWAKSAFEKDSAWDFKKKERHIYMYSDQKLAWFDETLDTWMGICRGSGVVILTKDGWKIQQYILSVAVPNHKIESYLDLD